MNSADPALSNYTGECLDAGASQDARGMVSWDKQFKASSGTLLMRFTSRQFRASGFLVFGVAVALYVLLTGAAGVAEQADAAKKVDVKAVEPDMHEFMEYMFEPGFKRLKPLMASEPADRLGWKGIKGDSLVLAEAGNLLLARVPEKDGDKWTELSMAVREQGGALYQAAKKRDFPTARKHYEAMVVKCNACHTHFAGGEHQLAP